MIKIQQKLKFLKLIVHSATPPCGITGLCGGYELKEWRYEKFADWLFDEHLLDFALTYEDYIKIAHDNAIKRIRAAAKNVFQSNNLNRGEFGELLLHGIIKETYDTVPAVSKIYFKDGPNETVKGFDAVHVVAIENELELWLGEVKFYNDFKRAVRDVVPEIEAHFQQKYLEKEFAAITNKIDRSFPYHDKLVKLLDPNTSLDDVFKCVCVPVLLTYDSDLVSKHKEFCQSYVDEILPEIQANHQHFMNKVTCPVKIHLFLLPLEDKSKLAQTLLNKLSVWQRL
jgi:hypothetical protein